MNRRLNKKTYEALGFVEAVLAIMIVGISSVVLMQIAVDTIQDVIQNEVIDEMTQYAVEGAEMVQDIANRNKVEDETIFPLEIEYLAYDNCFIFNEADEKTYFKKNQEGDFIKFEKDQRELYKDVAILDEEDYFFRIACLDTPGGGYGGQSAFVMSEIIVGQRNSDGTITKGNLAKDYIYRTVIRL